MLYTDKTYDSQKRLTNWVRTGKESGVPGATSNGLKQYRRLFRNNINNSLSQAYPISFEVLSDEEWSTLVDEFFEKHDAKTPHIWKLPFEFYQFVKANNFSEKFNYPFLNDLVHFEWLEIEVYTMPNEYPQPYVKSGDILNNVLEVNPEYRLTQLEYPVHMYAAKESVNHKGDYFLLTYREPKTFDVKFMNLDPLHVLFFEKVANENLTANQIIDFIIDQNNSIPRDKLTKSIIGFLETMIKEKLFMFYAENYIK